MPHIVLTVGLGLVLGLAACSGSQPITPPDARRDRPPGADRGGPDLTLVGDAGADQGRPDRSRLDLGRDAGPPSPYKLARGLVHLHSVYSHDGCDSKGIVGGKPDATCLKQLRDAVCARGFDFACLTDHPSNMSSYTMKEDLLFDAAAGDQLVLDAGGAPIANRITCAGGGTALLSVGFEATHMMPLGLHDKPPAGSSLYDGVTDATGGAAVAAQVQGLKALGAVAAMVHSEEADISASTIAAGGFEAMEWYNIHASILALTGGDKLSADVKSIPALAGLVGKLQALAPFLSGGSGAPHPDLVYLVLLDKLPQEGFTKWKQIIGAKKITGLLGSDIHQNVSVDTAMCAGLMQVVCDGALNLVESTLGITIPTALRSLLLKGGNVILADGDRLDSYGRLMRWLENRVLVTSLDPVAIQEAMRKGRSYGVFTVFGDPHGFAFAGGQGGKAIVLGESAAGATTLTLTVPDRPMPIAGGVYFSVADALTAEVRARLLRTDAAGTTLVHEETKLGATVNKLVSEKGAYHVELWIRPKHLASALGTASALATKEYLWLVTNPIVVE